MTISDVYKEYVRDGMNKDKAAGICLGIISGGLIDATDDETEGWGGTNIVGNALILKGKARLS